jgi:hypothetical protein
VREKRAIYLIQTRTRYHLASTFLRFQEHYESPRFRGKIFTLEEYMDWYAKKNGNFTYYSDWDGFNIPSRVLTPFRAGKFDPLSKREQAFLRLFKDIPEHAYIIGICDEVEVDDPALKHEFVHGLCYTVPRYFNAVQVKLRTLDVSSFHSALAGFYGGYSSAVFDDEINAHVLTGLGDLKVKIGRAKFLHIRRQLAAVFREHFGYSIRSLKRKEMLAQIHRVRLPDASL